MLHKLLTYSTMTAVVLHALLGCCVHHAHADFTHTHGVDSAVVEVEHGRRSRRCERSHEGHQSSCQHQANSDSSIVSVGDDGTAIQWLPLEPCSGPHGSCDDADCHIVADQRDNKISLLLLYDWSPLLTHSMFLSSQDLIAPGTDVGSPPDLHLVGLPLRLRTQVWRL